MHIFYMFYINIVIKEYNYTSGFSKTTKKKKKQTNKQDIS